jgi:hypothetical protein
MHIHLGFLSAPTLSRVGDLAAAARALPLSSLTLSLLELIARPGRWAMMTASGICALCHGRRGHVQVQLSVGVKAHIVMSFLRWHRCGVGRVSGRATRSRASITAEGGVALPDLVRRREVGAGGCCSRQS